MSAAPDGVSASTAPVPATQTPGGPQRSAEQIRRNVEAKRGELAGSVELLRHRVGELTDWRGQLRDHRDELIAAAAITGFVVGGLIALRRRRRG
jgi:hypothetical protein